MPNHKHFLVVQFCDQIFIDYNIPFGLASASGLQGKVADAGWLCSFSFPSSFYPILQIQIPLWPLTCKTPHLSTWNPMAYIHTSKGQDFASTFSYVSLFWNLTHKSVSLTSEKCKKHLAKITSFIQLASHPQFLKNDIESLNGSLSHISFVYLQGCTHLQNLIKYIKSFENNFTCHWTPTPVLRDLEWWQRILTQPNFTHSLIPHPTTVDHRIWVDASTNWGIGILFQDCWDA